VSLFRGVQWKKSLHLEEVTLSVYAACALKCVMLWDAACMKLSGVSLLIKDYCLKCQSPTEKKIKTSFANGELGLTQNHKYIFEFKKLKHLKTWFSLSSSKFQAMVNVFAPVL